MYRKFRLSLVWIECVFRVCLHFDVKPCLWRDPFDYNVMIRVKIFQTFLVKPFFRKQDITISPGRFLIDYFQEIQIQNNFERKVV
jgi:hypothetical protein